MQQRPRPVIAFILPRRSPPTGYLGDLEAMASSSDR